MTTPHSYPDQKHADRSYLPSEHGKTLLEPRFDIGAAVGTASSVVAAARKPSGKKLGRVKMKYRPKTI